MVFEFPQKCWLETSGEPFMTFDVDFKRFRPNFQTFKIFRGKRDLPSMLFYYLKNPY